MIKVGNYSFIIGLILTIVGLIAGFGCLYFDYDRWAQMFLMVVPLGFMILFAGLSMIILFEPERK